MAIARYSVMVKTLEELIAFQQAVAFKREVYAIVRRHAKAERDFRYRYQLFDAASGVDSNIAEGWRRFGHPDMIRFLRYSLGSLEEAQKRLIDGVDRGYFESAVCTRALSHAKRCSRATTRFIESLGGDQPEGTK